MPAPDPLAIRRWALALADAYGSEEQLLLATNPIEAVTELRGLNVVLRPSPGSGCDLDASYNRVTKTVTIDSTASPSRRRFSCLHELGHHDSDSNADLAEWLYQIGTKERKYVAESVCDAFAAELLLPRGRVSQHLVSGFGARQVAQLFERFEASREACVVTAADALRGPGLVVLADSIGNVLFSSARSLPFRIGRGVTQAVGSVISRAGTNGLAATSARETVTLRSGKATYTEFRGDAFRLADGYVFAVLRDAGDDVDQYGNIYGGARAWLCGECREDISDEPWCSECNRRRCSTCGCECATPTKSKPPTYCKRCGCFIPLAFTDCPDCT